MKQAIPHVDFCSKLCHEKVGRRRHFIFELATESRRCPIVAVRDLTANPGSDGGTSIDEMFRYKLRWAGEGAGPPKYIWTDICRAYFRMSTQNSIREQTAIRQHGPNRHVRVVWWRKMGFWTTQRRSLKPFLVRLQGARRCVVRQKDEHRPESARTTSV